MQTKSFLKRLATASALAISVSSVTQPATANQGSICQAPVQEQFFEIFNCGALWEIGWTGDFGRLQNYNRAEAMMYLNGLINQIHGPTAAFYLHPDVLTNRDPHLPIRAGFGVVADEEVINDTLGEAMTMLGDMFGNFAQARQNNIDTGRLDPGSEMAALFQGLQNGSGTPLRWAGRYGEHDFQVFAPLSQTDPALAVELYQTLVDLVEELT